ncbi:MAG: chromosome segregation protein SMC [Clostridiales bacterium]|nr:chromosome segregation protein SMC [Clostridiales bacterium]
MHLKRIDLQGFKSFAGKTVLEFNKGITCVVGPNGSGKSNIADAVRWVLGEQSAKQLRGSKMLDMIFSGTQFRRSVGYAEVSLIFDNEDQDLPIDYTEVVITRRLFRNGDSEYSINKNSCRLKDITNLFLDTGIGKEGYSIIGQGKIQEILSAKSEERRGIFEEAAGIMKYKVKKLEASRKLQRTEDNLLRIGDIVNELKNQINPLHEQSEVAKEFLIIRDRLKILEVGLYLNNLNNYTKRLVKYDENIIEIDSYITSENQALVLLKQQNIDRNSNIQQIEESEEEQRSLLNNYIMSVETTLHEISIANERITSVEGSIARSRQDIVEVEERVALLTSDYLKREERIGYFTKQYEKFAKMLDEEQQQMNSIIVSLGEKEKEIEQLTGNVYVLQEQISDVKISIRTLENTNISLISSLENIQKELQLAILEKDQISLAKQDLNQHVKKLKAEEKIYKENHITYIDKKHNNTNSTLASREQLEKTRTRLGIFESNLKIVSDMEKRMEGYRHSVKAIMEENNREDSELSGVFNIFGKLITVEEKFETAIEAALGGNLQNIVMKNEQSAKIAIEFLKKNHQGRATFMPLNSMRRNNIKNELYIKLKRMKGFINTADNLIDFDQQFSGVVSNLLGKIIICESFDDAKNMSRTIKGDYKIVTLEGEFFNIGGSITGGSLGRKGSRILGRDKEIKRLEKGIIEESKKIISIEETITTLLSDSKTLTDELLNIDIQLQEMNTKLVRSESDLTKHDSDYNKTVQRISKLNEQKTMLNDTIISQKKIIEVNREQQTTIEKQITNMRRTIAEFENLHLDERNRRDELHLSIADLKVSTNSAKESIANTSDTLARLASEQEELSRRKEMRTIDINDLTKKKQSIEQEIITKSALVKNPEEKEEQLRKQLSKLTNSRRKLEEDNTKHMDLVSEVNGKIIDFQNKITKVQVSKAKVESETEAMKNRMWDEYGLTHNEAMEKHSEIENIVEARKEIKEGKKRITELGPVNINAIEDYKKTNERYVFLVDQSDDLEKSKKNLYKIISEMNKVMKKVFLEKFEIINKKFERVFKELFEGGRAKIVLVNEEDVLESGIDIIVQPPGKKLQNMMLLSGGEKAFTAISLLFAILEMNPSPFCIFDEIEAALDDTNVIKFAEYINEYKAKTQFILITHRKGSMEHSDAIYGVTMQEHGVSKVVSMKMTD